MATPRGDRGRAAGNAGGAWLPPGPARGLSRSTTGVRVAARRVRGSVKPDAAPPGVRHRGCGWARPVRGQGVAGRGGGGGGEPPTPPGAGRGGGGAAGRGGGRRLPGLFVLL